jgi:hypothetical protein
MCPHPAFGTPLPLGEGLGVRGEFTNLAKNTPFVPRTTAARRCETAKERL